MEIVLSRVYCIRFSNVAHTENTFSEDTVETEDEPTFGDTFAHVNADFNDHLTLQEYVDINKNLYIVRLLTDTKLLSTVSQKSI